MSTDQGSRVIQTCMRIIISKIDEKDFSLEAYAKQLDKNDREKVKMMKRIDELETMLAKMKRKS